MDNTFFCQASISYSNEEHEHGIALSVPIIDPSDINETTDKFVKDSSDFYIIHEGTPNITYTHDGSAEQLAEIERIKNYIDSLETAYIDYDELESGLRLYYYSNDLPTNQWLDYHNEWQSSILPCTIMQGAQTVLFVQYGSSVPGNYTAKHAVVTGTFEMNTETAKNVFVHGADFTLNGVLYDTDTNQVIQGNVSITTSTKAYVAIFEDAV